MSSAATNMQHGIVYATRAGIEWRGDLYAPAGDGLHPAVIAVPGGGWLACDPGALRHWGERLARDGIAVFAIQYRVSATETTYPGAVQNVIDAIRFVRSRAGDFRIDPGRIGLVGASAGAHLGALAALAGDGPAFATPGAAGPRVKALACVYGVYDLFSHWQHELADFPHASARRSECFLGGSPFADRRLFFDASPISHVSHASRGLPVFVAWGTADAVVDPGTQSEPFVRALRQAGHVVRECPIAGAGHFWFSEEPPAEPGSSSGVLAPHLLRFLKRYL